MLTPGDPILNPMSVKLSMHLKHRINVRLLVQTSQDKPFQHSPTGAVVSTSDHCWLGVNSNTATTVLFSSARNFYQHCLGLVTNFK